MTNDQINAAIAEACGWTDIINHPEFGLMGVNSKTHDGGRTGIEYYCNDLNAMHEAEWSLTDDQLWRMAREIERNDEQWYFRATARQRAEAFLRTLGKWEEVQG
jgi:hypothetical protein